MIKNRQTLSFDKDRLDFKVERGAKEAHKINLAIMDLPNTPVEEDFIIVPFRALSSTVVGADSWKASDFSISGVLEASVQKLVGKPVYLDHNLYSVKNAIGVVESAEWQEASVDALGNVIPAGINVQVKVDAKANPQIARALTSEKPFIYSCSVTVYFDWKLSHNQEDAGWKIGRIAEDGKMICRQAIDILDYYELSLVFLGADPFAKMIKDGMPYMVDWSSVIGDEQMPSAVTVDVPEEAVVETNKTSNAKTQTTSVQFSAEEVETPTPEAETSTENLPIAEVETEEPTTDLQAQNEQLTKKITELEREVKLSQARILREKEALEKEKTDWKTKFEKTEDELINLKLDLETSEESLTKYKADFEKIEVDFAKTSETLNQFLVAKRAEAERLYLLSSQGKQDEGMLKMIRESDSEALETYLKQFGSSLFESFEIRCTCGKKVEYRSSVEQPLDLQKPATTVDEKIPKMISRKK